MKTIIIICLMLALVRSWIFKIVVGSKFFFFKARGDERHEDKKSSTHSGFSTESNENEKSQSVAEELDKLEDLSANSKVPEEVSSHMDMPSVNSMENVGEDLSKLSSVTEPTSTSKPNNKASSVFIANTFIVGVLALVCSMF